MITPKITKDTFVISDLHFGHKNVTEFEPSRAVVTAEEGYKTQEDMLIEKWNSVVSETDDVLILGDYAFKNIVEYTGRLNGHKILVRGNHDRKGSHAYYAAGFDYVYDKVTIDTPEGFLELENDDTYLSALIMDVGDQRVMFSHYPVDFYEDYYTRQRAVDLTMRVKKLSDMAKTAGVVVNIHGHTHSVVVDDTETTRYLNVSCEVLDFIPIKLGHLLDAAGVS